MTRERFFAHRSDMREDSWTYGEWRQYVVTRPDGALQCARPSTLPAWAALVTMVGAMLVGGVLGTMALTRAEPTGAFYVVAIVVFVAGCALAAVAGAWRRGYRLMTAVGPRQYDGRRIFDHEVS